MAQARERLWESYIQKRINDQGSGNWTDCRCNIFNSKWLAVFCCSDGQVRKIERREGMNIDDIDKLPTEELVKTIDWLDLLATTNANYIFAHMVAVGE